MAKIGRGGGFSGKRAVITYSNEILKQNACILSLTIIRMLPVFLSLTATEVSIEGKLFMG